MMMAQMTSGNAETECPQRVVQAIALAGLPMAADDSAEVMLRTHYNALIDPVCADM